MNEERRAYRRRLITLFVTVLIAGLCILRLGELQLIQADALNAQSKDRRAVPVTIPALRGNIIDRNGDILATTDELYDVQISPKNTKVNNGRFGRQAGDIDSGKREIVTSEQAYAEIAEVTGQTADEVKKIVDDALAENPKSDFAYIKRGINLNQLKKLKKLQIPWMTFASNFNRIYPNGAVAGNLTGFVGSEGQGQSGVELSQDACLVGEDGSEAYERSADGVALPGSTVTTKEVVNGGTVELTIDRDLQWQSQQIVNTTLENAQAEWVFQVVMDVKTGELLAVAEDYSVDPNDVSASDPGRRDARSFINPYEPGSTLKTATTAMLLNERQATPTTQNLTPDSWRPEPNVFFRDASHHEAKRWTLAGIMVNSSNVGISQLGSKLSPETRYNYLRAFGLGESTQAGLPVEDSGLLYPPEKWDPQTSYNTMFGQAVSSTIVQTAGVYQTIANGGERIPPTLVKRCTTADGAEKKLDHGKPVRVISPEAAADTTAILETIANNQYPGKIIEIPGYRLAGKTGTAEQPDGQGGYRSEYVHSFAGFFPAEAPQYVIVTSVGFSKQGEGGVHALTAWKQAAEAIIRHYHVAPSTGSFEPLPHEY